jgi:hypothetical protein
MCKEETGARMSAVAPPSPSGGKSQKRPVMQMLYSILQWKPCATHTASQVEYLDTTVVATVPTVNYQQPVILNSTGGKASIKSRHTGLAGMEPSTELQNGGDNELDLMDFLNMEARKLGLEITVLDAEETMVTSRRQRRDSSRHRR